MCKGEWLLRHYNEFKSRAEILTARLGQLKTNQEKERVKNEWIISASLGKPQMEDYIKGQGFNSRTESIALNCESVVSNELYNEKEAIIHEIADLEYCTRLCDSILLGLNESERWITITRFIEGKTLDAMVESQPQGLCIYSRQTMGKRCKMIINRIDYMLYGVDLPVSLYNEKNQKNEHRRE